MRVIEESKKKWIPYLQKIKENKVQRKRDFRIIEKLIIVYQLWKTVLNLFVIKLLRKMENEMLTYSSKPNFK